MEYIIIACTGNTTDFGDLTSAFATPSYNVEGCCNGTRGIFNGGHQSNSGDVLAYITVASTGNATAFGALSVDRYYPASLADATRAISGGGDTPSASNIIDYVAFDTTGDATTTQFAMGVQKVGLLNNRWTVYKNPYMFENTILVGFRGSNFLETGAVYSPYVPLIMTPLVYDPVNFTPRKGVMTRYAKKMVRPEFYGKVIVADVNYV